MGRLKEAGTSGLTRAALRGCLQNSVPAGSKQNPESLVNYLLDRLKKNGAIIMEEEGLAKIHQRMKSAGEDYRTAKRAILEGRHYARVAKLKETNLKKRAEPIQLRAALAAAEAKIAYAHGELVSAREEIASCKQELSQTQEDYASCLRELDSAKEELVSAQKELDSTKEELVSAQKELVVAKTASDKFECDAYTAQATNMGLEDQLRDAQHETNVMRGLFGVSLVSTGLYFFATLVLKMTQLTIVN